MSLVSLLSVKESPVSNESVRVSSDRILQHSDLHLLPLRASLFGLDQPQLRLLTSKLQTSAPAAHRS